MRQSGFAEMHLIVDSTRKQEFSGSIYHGRITGLGRNRPFIDSSNLITLDQYRAGKGTAFVDDGCVFYQCSIHISFILVVTKVRNIFPRFMAGRKDNLHILPVHFERQGMLLVCRIGSLDQPISVMQAEHINARSL